MVRNFWVPQKEISWLHEKLQTFEKMSCTTEFKPICVTPYTSECLYYTHVNSLVMHQLHNLPLVSEFVQFISSSYHSFFHWLNLKSKYNTTDFCLCECLCNKHLGKVIIVVCPFQKDICQPYSRYILQRKWKIIYHNVVH